MSPEIEIARREVEQTRAHIEETTAELKAAVGDRVTRAKRSVDPRHYAREYPWAAIGLAIGVGLAIGLSGADRKAATGAVAGVKKAGEAIGDGAVAAKDAVVERFHGSNDDAAAPAPQGDEIVDASEPGIGGLRGRVSSAVDDLLYTGLQEVLTGLGIHRGPV
jgi:hypothetical protein